MKILRKDIFETANLALKPGRGPHLRSSRRLPRRSQAKAGEEALTNLQKSRMIVFTVQSVQPSAIQFPFSLGERAGVRAISCRSAGRSRKEAGFAATVMFVGLLAIMLMLATAGGMALIHLHNEVRVLERQQIKRLDSSATNSVANFHVTIANVNEK